MCQWSFGMTFHQSQSYFNLSIVLYAVIGISVFEYWKISFYPLHTDTDIFYGGNTDIDTEPNYPKFCTEILENTEYFPVSK